MESDWAMETDYRPRSGALPDPCKTTSMGTRIRSVGSSLASRVHPSASDLSGIIKGPEERKRGNQPYKPTAENRHAVQLMTAAGLTQESIARSMKISVDTLARYYGYELDTGRDDAIAQVAGSLFRKAISDDHPQAASAAMFWLKTRAGWRETRGLDVSSGGQKMTSFNMYIYPTVKPDPSFDED